MNATKATFTKGRVAPMDDLDDTVCLLDITVELYDGKKKEQKKAKKLPTSSRVYPIVIDNSMLPAPQWGE